MKNGLLVKPKKLRIAIVVLAITTFISCSPVKYIPENEYLLNKVDVQVDNSKISKEEAKSYVRQKENYKILGFLKFHLWLYNLSSKKKSDGWLKRIGEPPEIFDEGLAVRSEDQLKQYLDNNGYFRSKVQADVEYKEKKQKVNVTYKIETGEQYTIRKINYHIADTALENIFIDDSAKTYIRPGTPFDVNMLDGLRSTIVNLFRNHGYYYFSKENIRFLADSTKYNKEFILDMFIGDSGGSVADSIKLHSPYYFNDFYISILPNTTALTGEEDLANTFSDTLRWGNFVLYRNNQMKYRPGLFARTVKIESGQLYNLNDVENTFNALNRLRQFRFVDIQFREPALQNDSNLLDGYIRLAPLSKQSVSFDIEGTNTSGNLGIAGNLNYLHRNLFNGAEILQTNLKGAMERQQRVGGSAPDYFNTRELGVEVNLTIPKLLGPGAFINSFRSVLPKTVFTLGYNFQRRPEYTRTISNVKFGYDWMSSETMRHTWNLLDFNRVNLYRFDPEFINLIKDLYIKSSFTDHLILAMNYSFVYNTQTLHLSRGYSYLRFNVESAGNLLSLLSKITHQPKYHTVDSLGIATSDYYRIFKTRYAQYVKTDIEFRHGYTIDKYNSIVGRAFLGVGLPYGNFDVLPFEKKYFTGGANGIRAWQVRSLGPGTYKAPAGAYPNQSSDIKIEANLEYRFKLIGILEGALFFDTGNIWAINEKDNRKGAQFKFNKFYKEFALGTGAGLRFDFNYFIFRLDLGVKLRDPSQSAGDGWIIGYRPYTANDFNLSFAIGYPF